MGKFDILTGVRTVEERNSKQNGKITVIKSLAWGTYFQVGGLTQSGGVVREIWQTVLKKVRKQKDNVRKCLILGLGGGSIVGLVNKFWMDTKIVGVDIDPVIVDLGKKYLKLNESNLDVKLTDAFDFVKKASKKAEKFDLICIDLYVGDNFPEKFEKDEFVHLVADCLDSQGVAVFNRLYYGDKRPNAVKFGAKLEKYFDSVEAKFPEANLMYICK